MVNNKKMESRLEGCDSRLKTAEEHIVQLGEDVNVMKSDFATLKSLLTEFMSEFKGKKKIDDSGDGGESFSHYNRVEHERRKEDRDERERMKEDRDDRDDGDVSSFRKLDMPLFSGKDPIGWVFRVERYFKESCDGERDA